MDPGTRGRRMDESLQLLRALSGGEPVNFEGEFFALKNALILPAPAPRIPLVVGGRSDAAVRRTARFGDGWLGIWVSPRRYRAPHHASAAVAVSTAGPGWRNRARGDCA